MCWVLGVLQGEGRGGERGRNLLQVLKGLGEAGAVISLA